MLDGGAGADTLIGGTGNDTYVVDNVGDVITENLGEGTDLVQSSSTYTLGANVENLTLTGSAAIDGTGNALNNFITGNAGDNVLDGGAGTDTLIGGTGNDTYVVDNVGDVVTENASEGTDTVDSSITYTLGANVEDLTLTGSSAINGTGNTLANIIIGNSASNSLSGGSGNDILYGGLGADTLDGGTGSDVFVYFSRDESAGASVDTIKNFVSGTDVIDVHEALAHSVSWTFANGVSTVSVVTADGTMTINVQGTVVASDFVITSNLIWGTDANDTLTGTSTNEFLFGGLGADKMTGGDGDDYYFVDNVGDQVIETAGGGHDTVESQVSYVLPSDLEDLLLAGAAAINGSGNALDNTIVGNSAANTLTGGDGNDTLVGGDGDDTLDGGTGADTMVGGLGDDTYVVDNAADVVTENAGEGTDTVQASINYTLGANVENLTLTGSSALNGTGNALNNVITGNSAANVLNGGAGADTMAGGLGDDTYVVDNAGDMVTENGGGGTDLVTASASFVLGANVENLTLAGSAAINGTGNALNNVILGNAAANVLDGGAGADTMAGGTGDDTYVVDNAGDVALENASKGTDTVVSSMADYTLGANIENLTLAEGAINGRGNDVANTIVGNGGNNLLFGNGGDDTLTGGAGNDELLGDTGNNDMYGGTGDDIYAVDSAGDQITEYAGEGVDTVYTTISYTLPENCENLSVLAANVVATGNELDNVITSNNASGIVLRGMGGNDQLIGYSDNDTLDGSTGADTMAGGSATTRM